MSELKEIGIMYRINKDYPKEVAENDERIAKMELGGLLIDKIVELQGDKHLKVRVEKRSAQVKLFMGTAEETEVKLRCYYREYESVDEIYGRLYERIAELKKENQELYKNNLFVEMQNTIERLWVGGGWYSDFAEHFKKLAKGDIDQDYGERDLFLSNLKFLREKAGGRWVWDDEKNAPVFVSDDEGEVKNEQTGA